MIERGTTVLLASCGGGKNGNGNSGKVSSGVVAKDAGADTSVSVKQKCLNETNKRVNIEAQNKCGHHSGGALEACRSDYRSKLETELAKC